jgi:hypothetical protein
VLVVVVMAVVWGQGGDAVLDVRTAATPKLLLSAVAEGREGTRI